MEQLAIQAQIHTHGAVCIGVCIFVVIMVAIGWSGFRKIRAFNRKHHIVSYDVYWTKFYDEDADEDYTIYE